MRSHYCINLEDMSRGELAGLDEATLHPTQIAYRKHIYNAKTLRIQGHISAALDCERLAERVYRSMPAGLRW